MLDRREVACHRGRRKRGGTSNSSGGGDGRQHEIELRDGGRDGNRDNFSSGGGGSDRDIHRGRLARAHLGFMSLLVANRTELAFLGLMLVISLMLGTVVAVGRAGSHVMIGTFT